MIEVIFYGRGGQGAVTASQILATAAFREGKYAQAFPYFGGERKGAPVMAYARISTIPIEVRNPIEHPNIAIVLDVALFKTLNPLQDLNAEGIAIINTDQQPEEIKRRLGKKEIEVYTIDATSLCEKIYGQSSIPKTNFVMLGVFAACVPIVSLESILVGIDQYFSGDDAVKAGESAKLGWSYFAEQK